LQHDIDENAPALQRPKHHGSQKRQVVPVAGCVPRHIAEQIERMRDQGGKKKLSRSAVVATLLMRAVQQQVDLQYGAMLEPVIEKAIDRNIQGYSNRTANIGLQAYYAAEQARILAIHTLRFLTDLVNAADDDPLNSPDELPLIIKVAQEEAWKNMTNLHRDKTAPPATEEDDRAWPS
jgi:hypothetical protein